MHRDRFRVVGLAAGHTDATFERQLADWPVARAWCAENPGEVPAERRADGGLADLATADGVEIVVVATTGMTALPAVLDALASGRTVALANKETLVTGGHLVAALLDRLGGDPLERLRPIDSEHSAIWQCLLGEDRASVARIILTASGGPFLHRPMESLMSVTPDEALAHPTWRMGHKITIDSATLVNKAFEAIEARWLYQLAYSRIEAVIHPRSVVHSLVEFVDGSFKAQLGHPDMRLPIQFALTYPERLPSPVTPEPPDAWGALEFEALDPATFPAYAVVRAAAERGGNRGVVLNAADEVAVEAFLARRIAFPRISDQIGAAVERWGSDDEPDLDTIVALDMEIRGALSAELGLERPD